MIYKNSNPTFFFLTFISAFIAQVNSIAYGETFSDNFDDNNFNAGWKNYPYEDYPFFYEVDEGRHPTSMNEWWYGFAHLNATSGNQYGVMFAYLVPNTKIFIIINTTNNNGTAILNYAISRGILNASTDWLNISYDNGGDHDTFYRTAVFNYYVYSEVENINISLNYSSNRPPLIHTGPSKGFVNMGSGGVSAYYSQTNLSVNGTLSLNGLVENVSGIGWIDRQWGNWDGWDWEWFALQLNNSKEIMISKIFDPYASNQIETQIYSIMYDGNYTSNTSNNGFVVTTTKWITSDNMNKSHGWNITIYRENISLTLLPYNDNKYAWESPYIVYGTWDGQSVGGYAWVENTHNWKTSFTSHVKKKILKAKSIVRGLIKNIIGKIFYHNQ